MHEKHVCRKYGDAVVSAANDSADDKVGRTDILEVGFAGCGRSGMDPRTHAPYRRCASPCHVASGITTRTRY